MMDRGTRNLRQQVLHLVRELRSASVRDVYGRLSQERSISLNAVATVMARLVEQGLLVRSGNPRHYLYEARPSEEAVRERAERTAEALLAESGELGLVHFVEAVHRIQPESIDKLESLLAESRRKRSGR